LVALHAAQVALLRFPLGAGLGGFREYPARDTRHFLASTAETLVPFHVEVQPLLPVPAVAADL